MPAMERVTARIREVFEAPEAAVYLVATGTAANALALACLCPPWATVYCHRNAHVEEDECGAPEFYTGGAKLTLLDGEHARIDPESLERAIGFTARAGVHNVQKGALSLSNATEAGAVYDPAQVAELARIARVRGIPVHMDGARFANARGASRLHAGRADLEGGGRRPELRRHQERLPRRRGGGALRPGHGLGVRAAPQARRAPPLQAPLPLGADGGVSGGRPLARPRRGGERPGARSWRRASRPCPARRCVHPTEANAVFASWPRAGHRAAMAAGAHYYLWPANQSLEGPDEEPLSARLVCNWATTPAEVAQFLGVLAGERMAGA